MQFPSTGALVRAVPLRGDVGPVSVPGDTQWKGAMGKSSFEQLEAPPPDITLECYDGTAEPQELLITWDLTWSDVSISIPCTACDAGSAKRTAAEFCT